MWGQRRGRFTGQIIRGGGGSVGHGFEGYVVAEEEWSVIEG